MPSKYIAFSNVIYFHYTKMNYLYSEVNIIITKYISEYGIYY